MFCFSFIIIYVCTLNIINKSFNLYKYRQFPQLSVTENNFFNLMRNDVETTSIEL